jgi:hypothetical protein
MENNLMAMLDEQFGRHEAEAVRRSSDEYARHVGASSPIALGRRCAQGRAAFG